MKRHQVVVIEADTLDEAARREFVQLAQQTKHSAHLIVLDAKKEDCVVAEAKTAEPCGDKSLDAQIHELTGLRKHIQRGEMGQEGFSSALLLTKSVAPQVRNIVLGRSGAAGHTP